MDKHIYSVCMRKITIEALRTEINVPVDFAQHLPKIHILYVYRIYIYNKYAKFNNNWRSFLRRWTNFCKIETQRRNGFGRVLASREKVAQLHMRASIRVIHDLLSSTINLRQSRYLFRTY